MCNRSPSLPPSQFFLTCWILVRISPPMKELGDRFPREGTFSFFLALLFPGGRQAALCRSFRADPFYSPPLYSPPQRFSTNTLESKFSNFSPWPFLFLPQVVPSGDFDVPFPRRAKLSFFFSHFPCPFFLSRRDLRGVFFRRPFRRRRNDSRLLPSSGFFGRPASVQTHRAGHPLSPPLKS